MAKTLSDKGFDSARYHPCNYGTLCQICKDERSSIGAGCGGPSFRARLRPSPLGDGLPVALGVCLKITTSLSLNGLTLLICACLWQVDLPAQSSKEPAPASKKLMRLPLGDDFIQVVGKVVQASEKKFENIKGPAMVGRDYSNAAHSYRWQTTVVLPPRLRKGCGRRVSPTTLMKQQEVPGGYDPKLYACERLWATARDGVKVPISIVYKKGMVRDGKAPLFLYVYGSYGIGTPLSFSSNRLSLLDRGMSYAIAHIRGGVDCAEFLIQDKWTSADRLVIEGGSAGGLLMGAVVNLRPDLFRAVHSAVPFVDVMNTMMDATLPLTVGEYLEWGDPNEKAAYDYMKTYSPYDNLEKRAYPAMLVTTSFNDSQVMYWEPAKYVARLRTLKTDSNPLLLKIKMDPAGHGGASGRYDRLKDQAFEYAWLLSQVGIAK